MQGYQAYDPMSGAEERLFFRHVSYRYGRGAKIITTNNSIRNWTEILAGERVMPTTILDRLLHSAHVLNFRGRSYRLRAEIGYPTTIQVDQGSECMSRNLDFWFTPKASS